MVEQSTVSKQKIFNCCLLEKIFFISSFLKLNHHQIAQQNGSSSIHKVMSKMKIIWCRFWWFSRLESEQMAQLILAVLLSRTVFECSWSLKQHVVCVTCQWQLSVLCHSWWLHWLNWIKLRLKHFSVNIIVLSSFYFLHLGLAHTVTERRSKRTIASNGR